MIKSIIGPLHPLWCLPIDSYQMVRIKTQFHRSVVDPKSSKACLWRGGCAGDRTIKFIYKSKELLQGITSVPRCVDRSDPCHHHHHHHHRRHHHCHRHHHHHYSNDRPCLQNHFNKILVLSQSRKALSQSYFISPHHNKQQTLSQKWKIKI